MMETAASASSAQSQAHASVLAAAIAGSSGQSLTGSHIELPENERDFQTFEYFMTLKDANLAKNAPVKDVDKSNSTDEIMYDLSLKKKQLNDSFINVLKKASIDCNIFKSFHPERQCQGDKVDKDTPLDKLAYEYHYKDDYVYVPQPRKQQKTPGQGHVHCRLHKAYIPSDSSIAFIR